jgi:hypothetical protein
MSWQALITVAVLDILHHEQECFYTIANAAAGSTLQTCGCTANKTE